MADAVLTTAEMRAVERTAMHGGTSEWQLMRRAGEGAAKWIARVAAGQAVTVLCGPGNNGGDGYVIAEALRRRGNVVSVIAPAGPGTETARTARAHYGGGYGEADSHFHPVVVDCLFGYGLSRRVEGVFAELLEKLARTHCYKIALDVPSAIESDSGTILGPMPRYDLTIALGAWKLAHWLMPAVASQGIRRLVDIGLDCAASQARVSTRPAFAAPAPYAHKYRRGLLAVVAGEMPGAAQLAAEGAMRAGAGYVKLLSEQEHMSASADLVVLKDVNEALDDPRNTALLYGPGAGRGENARARLASVIEQRKPTVLDADALHLLDADALEGADVTKLIVTPHEGELAKLCEAFGVSADAKLDRARGLHDVTGLTVLAKGPDTILATSADLRFFPRGSSWLSVAGTGDVLAGIVASRLAHHGDPAHAAEEGVWLHHEAARITAPAFTAEQLAQAVKPAMASFL